MADSQKTSVKSHWIWPQPSAIWLINFNKKIVLTVNRSTWNSIIYQYDSDMFETGNSYLYPLSLWRRQITYRLARGAHWSRTSGLPRSSGRALQETRDSVRDIANTPNLLGLVTRKCWFLSRYSLPTSGVLDRQSEVLPAATLLWFVV